MTQGIQFDQQTLAAAMALLMQTQKAGDASTTPTNQLGHGPGGTFAQYGLSKNIFNAMVLPRMGLMSRLKVIPTTELNPLTGILTGQHAVTGSHPADNCAPCKVAGQLKMGSITTVFGRTCISTNTIDLSSDIGATKNRGEFRDFRLIGNPVQDQQFAPSVPGSINDFLNRELDKELFQLYVGWSRDIYSKLLYYGNPVNNTGAYKEMRGLDLLINTGYQDSETGALLRAADSIVVSFGNREITGSSVAAGEAATDLVKLLSGLYRRLDMLASDTGMQPVEWVLAMPEMLFYEITAIWPCAYNTYRCSLSTTGDVRNQDATAMSKMTEDMRRGKYLLIEGREVEVQIDDVITQQDAGATGTFTAGIYFVPLVVTGAVPSTYIEYFDYDNANAAEFRNAFTVQGEIMPSDMGRFLWNRRKSGYCVSMDATERSRLRLETPFLAARVTNIKYTPVVQTRSGFPTDGPRFYNGGNVSTTVPSLYPPNTYPTP